MSKSILFLADGMADEPIDELNGKTPLEAAHTPNMDSIALNGASGTFLSLPDGFPTSSDVANMSVMGYDLAKYYPGRGPIEAVSQDIPLSESDVAWRCNLVTVENDILKDYSAGHIDNEVSTKLMECLHEKLGNDKISFYPGVSYRNLLVLHGDGFSDKIDYSKPDSSQGERVCDLKLKALDGSKEALETVAFLESVMQEAAEILSSHPLNKGKADPANSIWPWSPGHKPSFELFSDKYSGKKGAVISAVDVIFGIAKCAGMDVVKVPGATGYIDTNYKGKAEAAIDALKNHDFVYLHVEAIDECSHMGDLNLKMKAIEDFDSKIVGPVLSALKGQDVAFAVLPDHPVPIKLRKHTRTPVPVAVCGPHIKKDQLAVYSERVVKNGSLGFMKNDELMKLLLNLN
jgi:2,3-bisphosphoglycerate-independent phosphoglycerate mutase